MGDLRGGQGTHIPDRHREVVSRLAEPHDTHNCFAGSPVGVISGMPSVGQSWSSHFIPTPTADSSDRILAVDSIHRYANGSLGVRHTGSAELAVQRGILRRQCLSYNVILLRGLVYQHHILGHRADSESKVR